MKIIIESTTKIISINGVPARIWEGQTESGIRVHCFVPRIAIDSNEPRAGEFHAELQEQKPPVAATEAYPFNLFID